MKILKYSNMKIKRVSRVYIALPLMSLILAQSCSSTDNKNVAREAVKVETVTIDPQQNSLSKEYVGTVEGSTAASLSFITAGTVEKVYVSEGEFVNKGQILATLNRENLDAMNVAAQSTLSQAKDALSRIEMLYNNKSIPEIQYVEVKTKYEQAESAARVAARNLSNATLRAPFSGVIGKRKIEEGESAVPGICVLTLMKIESVKVKFAVPENEIASVNKGYQAKVTLGALPGRLYVGKITDKGVSGNMLSHTYDVKITLPNPKKEMLPGMVCRVTIPGSSNENSAIVLPNRVIQTDSDGRYFVWTAQSGIASKRYVTPGALTENGVVIASGLAKGDTVIVDGSEKISEGTKISYNGEK